MFSLYYLFINCQEKHFDKTIQKIFLSLMYNKKVLVHNMCIRLILVELRVIIDYKLVYCYSSKDIY